MRCTISAMDLLGGAVAGGAMSFFLCGGFKVENSNLTGDLNSQRSADLMPKRRARDLMDCSSSDRNSSTFCIWFDEATD